MSVLWQRVGEVRYRRIGRGVLAQHQDGHAFWSGSGFDFEQTERNAVSQLTALARLITRARMFKKVDFSSRIR